MIVYMALLRQLLTARKSGIKDDIETPQSQINSKESDITSFKDRLDTGENKIIAFQSLTISHTSQLTSNGDILSLNERSEK